MADILGLGDHRGVFISADKTNIEHPDDNIRLAALGLTPALTDRDILALAAQRGLTAGVGRSKIQYCPELAS